MKSGDTITCTIEKNVYGGDGLARHSDGCVVFVPGAFAGEEVSVRVVQAKKHFAKAALVKVLKPSPDRIVSDCADVPGCVYGALASPAELAAKKAQLESVLAHVAHVPVAVETVAAPSPLHYRNKVVFHAEKGADGKWALGYRLEPSNKVLDMPACPLACAEINAALPAIRAEVMPKLTRPDDLTIRYTKADGVKWWLGDAPQNLVLHETTAGLAFEVSADGFYQINPAVGDLLVGAVRDAYAAGAEQAPDVLDLYCGVGVFGLACLAAKKGAGRLVGVESGRSAVASAKRNAAALGVEANFFCERVGGSIHRLNAGPTKTVIVDPPRGGFEPGVADWLAKAPAPRILCVSCDPATLGRDLGVLLKSYEIVRARLFDMFPRTARFETFVELRRRG